ncbi:MAG: DUF3450 family protein [Planctomycetota bacterium]
MGFPTWAPWFGLVLVLAASAVPAQVGVQDGISTVRSVLEKWVETRGVLSKEAQAWALGKETLATRIEVVEREIQSLRTRKGEAEASVAEADKKRAELLTENEQRQGSAVGLQQRIGELEQRARTALPRLPEPLRERIKPLSQRLPQESTETKLSLGERYQNVVGMLNEIQKWNREITVTSEVRALADGSSVEVAVLYVGLGQGYYASANGKVAGTGSATREGWVWKPANELAPAISQTIAIFKNEQVAAFVRLPVQVL